MTPKRQEIQNKLLLYMKTIDSTGYNKRRYEEKFKNMTDEQFSQWMDDLSNKKTKLMLFAPNLKVMLKLKDIFAAAKLTNSTLFDQLYMIDEVTGQKILTNYKYLILKLPIRRTRQFLMHKLSVSASDKKLDSLTGQVVGDDKSSAISFIEAQLLYSRGGFNETLTEFLKVRGGDIHAYANFKQQLEENGSVNLSSLPDNTVTRSTVVMSTILKCMLLDNNYV